MLKNLKGIVVISHKLSKNGLLILLFHGVIEKHSYGVRNYIRKHIEADYFRDILVDLKSKGPCLSMDQVIQHYQEGLKFAPNSFAITFDDGFENNYSVAAPILEELDLPSIFYITTDFIERGTMSWTDQAEYALEAYCGDLQEVVCPWLGGDSYKIITDEDKISFMKALRGYIFEDETRNPHLIVDWLYETLDVERVQTTDDPLDKKLSWQQIREMAGNPLFTIGGHTHNHPIMSGLDDAQLSYEISINLDLLKNKGGVETVHYAYPQGQANHYSDRVIKALMERNITCCPTAIDGINTLETGLFHLRRYLVDGFDNGDMI